MGEPAVVHGVRSRYRAWDFCPVKSGIFAELRWYRAFLRPVIPMGRFLFFPVKTPERILNMRKELPKTYSPSEFESRIYSEWCEQKLFTPEIDHS